jgi:hypothetical protein
MHDPALVRVRQRRADSPHELERPPQRHALRHERPQRAAVHQLAHEVRHPRVGARVEHVQDRRVPQPREHLALALEPRELVRPHALEHLQRDLALEPALAREPHRPHAALTERPHDLVRREELRAEARLL